MSDEQKLISSYLDNSEEINPELENNIEQEIISEIEKEQQFGDRSAEAGALEAASAASFGLSDQALVKSGLYTPEELREVRERSPIASTAGMVAGIAAPALATGGTSLAAKGIQAVGAPVVGAIKAGAAAERIAGSALNKLIADTGRRKLAKQVLKAGIAGAVEGGAFGLGEAIKEDALGKADLNAENIVASVGTGALLGGGAGGLFGAARAAVPAVARGVSPITNRVKSSWAKIADPVEAAKELTGFTAKELRRIEKSNPTLLKELPEFYKSKLNLQTFDDVEQLAERADIFRAETGKKIGNIVKEVDTLSKAEPELLPTKAEVYSKIAKDLDSEFIAKYKGVPGFKDQIKPVNQIKQEFELLAKSPDKVSVEELHGLRQKMDELAFKTRSELTTYKSQAARSARTVLRGAIDDIANKVSLSTQNATQRNLLQELKQANRDFSVVSDVLEPLSRKAKKTSFVSFPDIVETAAGYSLGQEVGLLALGARRLVRSDLRRNLAILADVQKQANAVQGRIGQAVETFFDTAKKVTRPASLKVLLSSQFSKSQEKPKDNPKNRAEAFSNISNNLAKLTNDQDYMLERLAKSTGRIGMAAPNIAREVQTNLTKGVQFLQEKLPKSKNSVSTSIFKREYEPSSMELAKFERYLQAVEAPLSVLDDLESGNLTREHVEALQVVYPQLYSSIRDAVLENVKNDSKLSYNKKVQLGILLGASTDESMTPDSIRQLQENFIQQDEPGQEAAVKPTVAGASKVDFSNRAMTVNQQVVGRRGLE